MSKPLQILQLELPKKATATPKTHDFGSGFPQVTCLLDLGTIYSTWSSMMGRCYTKTNPAYKNYGGRGITVCEEWHSAENFIRDMGLKNEAEYTLERIDNNKEYSKDNCKWATKQEQARNRRSNIVLEFNNKKQTMIEWCEELDLDYVAVQKRLERGWTVERALSRPTNKDYTRPKGSYPNNGKPK